MNRFINALLCIALTTACAKEDPAVSGCDCSGPSNYILRDELAIHDSTSIYVLSKQRVMTYCNSAVTRGKAVPNDTVYVSGIVRGSCGFSDIDLPRLEVTRIIKK